MTKQILVNINYESDYIDKIRDIASGYKVITDIHEATFEKVEIVLGWHKELKPVLESKEHGIKWIQLQSAGADYIPFEQLEEQNITLTTSSGMHAKVIAETILGMMLGYARKLFESQKYQAKSEWAQDDLSLSSLDNKVLTIVGVGNIGAQTAKVAKAFGMHTIGVNRSGKSVDHVDEIFIQEDLKQAVSKADYIVNILPLTDETTGLFNTDVFNALENKPVFVNVGRGASVVTDDLLDALNNNQLAFASLDVFEQEPLDKDHPLWQHDKVFMTPHTAGFMDDYIGTLFPIIEENLTSYVNNSEVAINKVDFARKY